MRGVPADSTARCALQCGDPPAWWELETRSRACSPVLVRRHEMRPLAAGHPVITGCGVEIAAYGHMTHPRGRRCRRTEGVRKSRKTVRRFVPGGHSALVEFWRTLVS